MKHKIIVFFLAGFLLYSSFALAAETSQSEEEKLKEVKGQIAEDAAFIRQVNNNSQMTPDQRKKAIAEFLHKQNEKIR